MQCAGTGKDSDKEGDSARAVVEAGEMRVSECGLQQEGPTKEALFAHVRLSDKLCPYLYLNASACH